MPNTCATAPSSGIEDQLLAGRQLTTWCASRLPKLGWRSSEMPRDVLTSTGRTWKDTAEGSVLAESSNLHHEQQHVSDASVRQSLRATNTSLQ